jgi:hypothetical protein
MNIGKLSCLLLMLMFFVLGCTNKPNPVGTDWSHIRPASISDSLFTNQFSFTTPFKLTGNEQKLIVGSYEQKTAKSLLQFISLPDSIYQIVGTPTLRLVLGKRFSADPITLHFDKVVQNWSESGATWLNAYSTPDTVWSANYTVSSGIPDFSDIPDTIAVLGDTLHIDIPAESIQNWKLTNITGYSLQISTTQSNYIEIRSTESLFQPELVFKYKLSAADTTTYSYDHFAANDTFIMNDTNTQLTNDGLFLRDISPTRLFMKFDVPRSLFTYSDNSGDILSVNDFKHMTVNKAELVLNVKDNPYYGNSATFMATVYRVKTSITDPAVISDDDMEFITYTPVTTTSPGLGKVSINFTPILQSFTSYTTGSNNHGKENFGIIIRLTTENQDYSKVEFYGNGDDVPVAKRPKINIIYTPPFF